MTALTATPAAPLRDILFHCFSPRYYRHYLICEADAEARFFCRFSFSPLFTLFRHAAIALPRFFSG